MGYKITKYSLPYPDGFEPDYVVPLDYCEYRFAIGKSGKNPLVAICMNPSVANDELSDKTINRIIKISKMLGMDGWIVFNTYPERATNSKDITDYNEYLSDKNIQVIRDFLVNHDVLEVWGAWGNAKKNKSLLNGKKQLLQMLEDINVNVFYFGTLTKEFNPRHPLQRNEKWVFTNENKHFYKEL